MIILLAKLHAYGFRLSALKLIHIYLKNRKRRAKIDSTYCSWDEILLWVPQGSILGPLLINIFMCDLLYSMNKTEFANDANDTKPCVTGNMLLLVLVLKVLLIQLKMFQSNYLNSLQTTK